MISTSGFSGFIEKISDSKDTSENTGTGGDPASAHGGVRKFPECGIRLPELADAARYVRAGATVQPGSSRGRGSSSEHGGLSERRSVDPDPWKRE